VVNLYEEEMMEDGTDIERSMQKHFEDFSHEKDRYSNLALNWKYFVVVVYISNTLPVSLNYYHCQCPNLPIFLSLSI
jgi:hypothetical protein